MSQRNRNIILWVVAIGLLVSMVISFTPGSLFGNRSQQEAADGPVALTVNGEPIRELEIARLEQNPPFNAVQEGPAAQDLQRVLLDQLVTQKLLQQAAADVSVSSGEVRTRVDEFRKQQGVAGGRNDRAYQNLLAGAGYTDGTFRDLTRQQLQQEKYLSNLTTEAAPTDEEIQTYYTANQRDYQSEPRITAREIVVADKDKADALYAQALTGADFAALARENSTERAEQGGALGAAEGNDPQPVTSVALPTAVSQAAFALQGPGLTAPVAAGGVYHIVKVEGYTPAGKRPLDEVRSEVETDLTDLKKAAAEEKALRTLKASAEISSPAESSYRYKDPVVARVGDAEITEVELDRNTYLNPQIQQLLNPNFAGIIASSVKPNVLSQMIDAELAVQGAKTLGGTFVGPDSAVAQSALGYVSRNVKVSDAQVQNFYKENQVNYTEQPSALTTRINFPETASARDFRKALTTADAISAESINIAAEAAGSKAENLGTVAPGGQPEAIDSVLFDFDKGMTELGKSGLDISQVLTLEGPATESGSGASGGAASGGATAGGAASSGAAPATQKQFVVLVAARTPERVRPLSDVRAQVKQAALQQRQNARQQEWLGGLRKKFPVENLLASAEAAANTTSGGAASGGAENGGAAGGPVLTPTPVPAPEGGGQNGGSQNSGAQNGGAQNGGAQDESAVEDSSSAAQPDDQNAQGEATQTGTPQDGGTQTDNIQADDAQNDAQTQESKARDTTVQNITTPAQPTPAETVENPQGAKQTGTAAQRDGTNSKPQKTNAQGQGTQSKNQGNGAQQTKPQTQDKNQNGTSNGGAAPKPATPKPQGNDAN